MQLGSPVGYIQIARKEYWSIPPMNNDNIARISNLKEELAQITEPTYPTELWPQIKSWIAKATPVIRRDWPDFLDDFQTVAVEPKGAGIMFMSTDFTISNDERLRVWKIDVREAKEIQQNILNFLDGLKSLAPIDVNVGDLDEVLRLCKRFQIFAQQLKVRERGRTPLEIEDEYDIQYLFLALLRLHFDDVRKEEWTPSYAGSSSRMDFLLKRQKFVLEIKKTRDSLASDKQVGDQLIIDIERYAQHPDCQTLICFVYDPTSLLDNPKGLEQDLSGKREQINVMVIISPSA